MASIENRSKFVVTVRNRPDLKRSFRFNQTHAVEAYLAELRSRGHNPSLSRTDDSYVVRIRRRGAKAQSFTFRTAQEAAAAVKRFEADETTGLFIDYSVAQRVTLGELMARYAREISPKHKSFEVECYVINAMLADAGLPRVDMAQAYANHPQPHPALKDWKPRQPSGHSNRTPAGHAIFLLKPFAKVVPEDIEDYIDERLDCVEPGTVDREIDILSAVCRVAMQKWRIHAAHSPMDGVDRPRYINERDRRLRGDEEQRLLDAAYEEDERLSRRAAVEALMRDARAEAAACATASARKAVIKAALQTCRAQADEHHTHVPLLETFVQFQLMTAARRSEALRLRWSDVDLDEGTAFIAESKNGRPRHLWVRSALAELLRQLPRTSEFVFPISVDALRKSWGRICAAAGLVDDHKLRIHDLRHEAISRVAEASSKLTGGFSVVDLQAYSGHRDLRMLSRYTHLCAPAMAKRLDEAFEGTTVRKGRRRAKLSEVDLPGTALGHNISSEPRTESGPWNLQAHGRADSAGGPEASAGTVRRTANSDVRSRASGGEPSTGGSATGVVIAFRRRSASTS